MGDILTRRPSKRPNRPAKYNAHYNNYVRIHLSLTPGMLELLDKAAKDDYTTRSDLVRTAIFWYLRPAKPNYRYTDPAEAQKTTKYRKYRRQSNKDRFEGKLDNLDVYDG